MRSRRIILLILGWALLAAACGSSDGSGAGAARLPSDPEALPEFTLTNFQQMLTTLHGTPVLVNFWASWCGPCREEAPLLASADQTYGDRVQFVGVDIIDARGSARAFMRESGWTYPSVFDPTGAIRDGLGLIGQPVTLFYDADGNLVDRWLGPLSRSALRSGLQSIL